MYLDLQYVEMKNFLSFGNKVQRFDFLPGINLILGRDKDTQKQNGAGKSNFLESIVFGLFGKTSKDIKKSQLVNWKNKKNLEVRICFKKESDEYIIHRGLKPDFLRLYKVEDGKENEIDQLSDKRDFQQYIEESLLCMDYVSFISTIYCNINTNVSIFDVAKKEKRKFLENIFSLKLYTDLSKYSLEKIKMIQRNISDFEYSISHSNNSITDLKEQNIKYNDTLSKISLKESRKQLEKLEKNYEAFTQKRIEKTEELSDLNKEKESTLLHRESITKKRSSLERIKYSVEARLKTLIEKENKSSSYDEEEYASILEKIEKLKDIDLFSFDDCYEEISALTEKIADLQRQEKTLQISKAGVKGQINSLPKLEEIETKVECPVCLQEIDKNLITKKIGSKRSILDEEIHKLENQIMEINEEIEGLKTELDEKNSLVQRMSKIKVKRADLLLKKNTLVQSKESYDSFQKDKTLVTKCNRIIKKVESRLENISNLLNSNQADLARIEKEINVIEDYINDERELLNEIEKKKQQLTYLEDQEKIVEDYISDNKKKIKSFQDKISKDKKDKEDQDALLEYVEYVKSLCGDEQVKQYAISHVVPFLNKKANGYLAEAGFGFYLKFDNFLNEEIRGPGISDATFGNLSGGENKCTNLAMQLSFLDVSKLCSPIFPNILLLDEILDSAIDSQTIEKMMDIVRKKQKEDNSKIFIVSHRAEMNSFEFDNIYKVEKEKGFSYIRKTV